MAVGEVVDLARQLVGLLRSKYVVSYRELLAIVPPDLIEEVVLYTVRTYSHKYNIACELGAEPQMVFYGSVGPGFVSERELLDRLASCTKFVKEVLRLWRMEEAAARCRNVIVSVGGRNLIRLSDRIYMDDVFLYVLKNGRLTKNMRWRIVYQKYSGGDRRPIIRWLGEKIEAALPCIDLLSQTAM